MAQSALDLTNRLSFILVYYSLFHLVPYTRFSFDYNTA